MKLSWGYRIAMLYVSFALFIAYFVTRSMQQKIDLVVPDYYEQELSFQSRLENSNRNNELSSPLSVRVENNNVVINYPDDLNGKSLSGNILFFRPSDNGIDKNFPVNVSTDNSQRISTTGLQNGMYRVKAEFECEGQHYYSEQQIIINR